MSSSCGCGIENNNNNKRIHTSLIRNVESGKALLNVRVEVEDEDKDEDEVEGKGDNAKHLHLSIFQHACVVGLSVCIDVCVFIFHLK